GAVGQSPHDGAAAARQVQLAARLAYRERERVESGKRAGIERLGGPEMHVAAADRGAGERADICADLNRSDAAHWKRGKLSLMHEAGRAVNLNRSEVRRLR